MLPPSAPPRGRWGSAGSRPGGLGGEDGRDLGSRVPPAPSECLDQAYRAARNLALGPVVYPPAPVCLSCFVELLWGLCPPYRDFFVISLIFKQSFFLSEKDLALIIREVF